MLSQLNDSQRKAVEYCDGASLVIAGAGSGKTRVLTYKIAWLLEQGMAPWQILALTFTNKAAREMKERIARLVGEERARYLQMGTFHSVFARILRNEAEHIGYNSNFTIYDQSDARSLVKTIIKEMQLDDKVYKPASVADRISMAKNHLLLPQVYASSPSAAYDAEQKRPEVKNIYIRYVERCRQANAMDFDDLLVQTWVLFQNHEDIRRKYVERFHFVLVDEYQDTNYAQQAIVYQLTKERQKVCVVGDDGITPPRTKYRPLKIPERSNGIVSELFSTTQSDLDPSREVQTEQMSRSVNAWHLGQGCTFSMAFTRLPAKRSTSALGRVST